MDEVGINYIKKSRELGRSDDDIRALLVNAGHAKAEIDAAFSAVDGGIVAQTTNSKTPSPSETKLASESQPAKNSSLQIRTSFWVGLTIWTNPFAVLLVYLFFYYALNFLQGSNTMYVAYLEAIAPVIGLAAIVFAVWLGVRLVKKAMWIDPNNFLAVSLYSTLVPFSFVVALFTAVGIYTPGQVDWLTTVGGSLFSAVFFFVLTYYFLSNDRRVGYATIILIFIALAGAVLQGYSGYEQAITITHAGKLVNLIKP